MTEGVTLCRDSLVRETGYTSDKMRTPDLIVDRGLSLRYFTQTYVLRLTDPPRHSPRMSRKSFTPRSTSVSSELVGQVTGTVS